MTLHVGDVGKYRVIELDGVGARCKTVDRVRSKPRLEHERVGTGARVENIVRSTNQCRWAATGSEHLIAQMSIHQRREGIDLRIRGLKSAELPVVVQVLVEAWL